MIKKLQTNLIEIYDSPVIQFTHILSRRFNMIDRKAIGFMYYKIDNDWILSLEPSYYNANDLHRLCGPSIRVNNKDLWYYEGKLIPVDNQYDFEKYIKLLAFK